MKSEGIVESPEKVEDAEGPSANSSFGSILVRVVKSPAFLPGLVVALGISLCFWKLFRALPEIWLSEDGYYSHGFLVPFITGYIIYNGWPKLRVLPVQAGWLALIPLAAVLYVARVAVTTDIQAFMSLTLLVGLLASIWFVAGWRWMKAITLPTLYLGFALPLWTMVINVYTNPLQRVSTDIAFKLLQFSGLEPLRDDATTIYLNQFTLDVGVPCSGLKLLLALSAFTVLFMLIANLRWWANVVMVLFVLPLCLGINGLRIMLIGVVGNRYGADAGMQFHDYSGYITLILCFVILFRLARWLGWKS